MSRQLFIDLDGVLADFDAAFEVLIGFRPPRAVGAPDPPGMWEAIEKAGTFYRDLAPMADMHELWNVAKRLHPQPIVLTGVPRMECAAAQKRAWVAQHLGEDVHVITCWSRDKRKHGKPGDVLVDDWLRYRSDWEEMGGVFVHHTSAADSLSQLAPLFASEASIPAPHQEK